MKKLSKKVLTKGDRCDRIVEHRKRAGAERSLKIEQRSKEKQRISLRNFDTRKVKKSKKDKL